MCASCFSPEGGPDGWSVRLDGRGVKTPARKTLTVPSEALATMVAEEWAAQGERIDAPAMPLTRLCFVALDRMELAREETIAEVTKYASTDLVCFRAPDPAELVAAQAAAWDPMLAWAEQALEAHAPEAGQSFRQTPRPAGRRCRLAPSPVACT